MQKKKVGAGNALLLLAALLWGFAFSAQKTAGQALSPFAVGGVRFSLGAGLLFVLIPLLDRYTATGGGLFSPRFPYFLSLRRQEVLGGVLCGLSLFCATALQQAGIGVTDPGKAAFLTALYVVFVPLLGLLFGRRVPGRAWACVGLALLGACLLSLGGVDARRLGWGEVAMLASAILFACHVTLVEVFARGTRCLRLAWVQFATVGVLNLFLCLPFGGINPSALWEALPSLLYLGIFACGVAYTAQAAGQKLTESATLAALIMSLEAVFGALGGALLWGERLGGGQLLGCGCIFLSPLPMWVLKKEKRTD